jgi:L-asparaginase / beta-aspartyl-peptidase
MLKHSIAIHGGAGTILRSEMSPEKESKYLAALEEALEAGYEILHKSGSALDAVETAVSILEDCPLFNAGRGSVFTFDGKHEMDASIMDGCNLDGGAVAMLRNVKNPVQLARLVMDQSNHVFLAGEGAEEFAKSHAVQFMPSEYFYDEFRYQQWLSVKGSEEIMLDHISVKEQKFGTVGAVARDQHGNLAAATSTGGMTNKKFGRIGDTPMLGAGTYADNSSCAISCTGSGEYFIRVNAAFHVHALIKYQRLSLQEACDRVVQDILPSIGGDGGLIGVDHSGNVCLCFNTEGMYRASKDSMGKKEVLIYV